MEYDPKTGFYHLNATDLKIGSLAMRRAGDAEMADFLSGHHETTRNGDTTGLNLQPEIAVPVVEAVRLFLKNGYNHPMHAAMGRGTVASFERAEELRRLNRPSRQARRASG